MARACNYVQIDSNGAHLTCTLPATWIETLLVQLIPGEVGHMHYRWCDAHKHLHPTMFSLNEIEGDHP